MNIEHNWTRNYMELENGKLYYFRTGTGEKPPLILVHGFSDNGLCWLPVARELEKDFDVVMPDMRGHGLSVRAADCVHFDMALDIAELIKKLNIKHPVVGGHSMGAAVTFEFAVRFPDIPRALFFEDPPWWMGAPFGADAGGEISYDNPVAKWAKTLPAISIEELIDGYTKDNPSWPPELIQVMCKSKKQLDTDIVDILTKKMFDQKFDWKKEIAKFTQPLLLFSGDSEKGGFVTPEVMKKVKDIKPDATIVPVSGVGHLIRFDAFPVFIKSLKKFLQTLL